MQIQGTYLPLLAFFLLTNFRHGPLRRAEVAEQKQGGGEGCFGAHDTIRLYCFIADLRTCT